MPPAAKLEAQKAHKSPPRGPKSPPRSTPSLPAARRHTRTPFKTSNTLVFRESCPNGRSLFDLAGRPRAEPRKSNTRAKNRTSPHAGAPRDTSKPPNQQITTAGWSVLGTPGGIQWGPKGPPEAYLRQRGSTKGARASGEALAKTQNKTAPIRSLFTMAWGLSPTAKLKMSLLLCRLGTADTPKHAVYS